MSTKENYFRTSDDALLYFEDHSPEKTETIVLVPGYCCSTRFFARNIPVLAEQYRVVSFDPRGQGRSSKGLQGHTLARNATDIRELLEFLGIESAALLAWSMGGQILMKYYDLFGPHRLSSLGLIDCPLGAMQDEPWNAHGLKGFNMDTFNDHLIMSYGGYKDFMTFFAHLIWDGNDEDQIEWSVREFISTPPWISYAIYSDYVFTNGYEVLAKVDIPMVFFGANSAVTKNGRDLAAKWYPEKLKPGIYHESFTYENGGHAFFFVESESFNRDLLSFLARRKHL